MEDNSNLGTKGRIKSERAKARWAILRSALVSSKNSSNNNDDKNAAFQQHSIHRFGGFRLLKRRMLTDGVGNISTGDFDIVEYTIPFHNSHTIEEDRFQIITRERKTTVSKKKNLTSLMSHVHHGVDNTGQTRVWESSTILTYCLFSSQTNLNITNQESLLETICSLQQNDGTVNVVELGAGMAGLPSLSLAAYPTLLNNLLEGKDSISIKVTITDGHPEAVQNNQLCASLTSDHYKHQQSDLNNCISIQQLLWKDNKEGAQECQTLLQTQNNNNGYDLLLCSDCTHFQEFHAALAATIGRLLRVGGMAILCQPHRGNSLTRFRNVIRSMNGLFSMNLTEENYNEKLYQKHLEYQKTSNGIYDANIHYPLLLILRKQRKYDETLDTSLATEHMKQRDVT